MTTTVFGYTTILAPETGLWLFLALNVLVPVAALLVGQRVGRFGLVPHLIAFVWIISSPFLMADLTLPDMQPGEDAGLGDGIVLLPVMLEAGLFGLIYAAFLLVGLYAWLSDGMRTALTKKRR